MYSWRDPSYYQSDPWRGRWDTEGGGVLVNQSPHMIDLLLWLMDDQVAEVSGYWANLNHPSVAVEDSAVAILRFKNGGLGSIVASLVAEAGHLYQGAHSWIKRCIARRRDRPGRDLHRGRVGDLGTPLERPVDDSR